MIITLDGPAGTGKSTVSKELAKRLGFLHLDSGAIYRAGTLAALKENVDFEDVDRLTSFVTSQVIELTHKDGNQIVILNGENVSEAIRMPEVTEQVKHVAGVPEIREWVTNIQREVGNSQDTVVEGRDASTVVFPDAFLKIYLDATPEIRAKRRFRDYEKQGLNITYEQVLEEQQKRDASDMSREASPLKVADDAVVIDGSDLTVVETAEKILSIFNDRNNL